MWGRTKKEEKRELCNQELKHLYKWERHTYIKIDLPRAWPRSVFPFKLACLNRELTRAFRARSVTYNKAPYPLDSLLSMTMTERKKKELGNLELKHLYKSKRNTHTHTHTHIYIYQNIPSLGLTEECFSFQTCMS